MEYKRYGREIVLRLDRGDEIGASVLALAKAEAIGLATLTGIGATDDADVGVFNTETNTYNRFRYTGTHEITALCGNLTTKDGEPYSHLHISLAGADGTLVGGHLLRVVVSLTAEIVVTVLDGCAGRKPDPALGINKIAF